MSVLPNERSRVALSIAIFAVLAAVASVSVQLAPNTWMFRDGRFYANVTTTIAEDLTIEQHRFAASWYSGTLGWNRDLDPGWSNVALGRNGEHWPKHPYVLPFFASPLYFALGLPATLLFNLLMYGVIATGLFRFARAYAEPESAALASALFVFATIIVGSAYDFSTDVLMLALFSQGLAAVKERRGAWAGIAMGLCVVIKPTALMLLPSLVLVFFERVEDRGAPPDRAITRRELGRSIAGGSVVLALFALANTWMYGRPWWSGYNRTLVTANGAPSLASHTDAFSVPLEQGFQRVMFGDYGLLAAFGVLALAAPGLVVMLRTRARAALAAVVGVALSLVVFSLYVYEGHRFHWPALALLVPAIATTFAWLGRRTTRATTDAARRVHVRESVLVGAAALAATMFTLVGSPRGRLGGGAWVDAALASLPETLSPEAAPFVVIAIHALAAGVLCGALASMIEGPRALRAIAVLAPFGVPEVRLGMQQGGLFLVVLAVLALGAALVTREARVLGERALLRSRGALAAIGLGLVALAMLLFPHDTEGSSLSSALRESWHARNESRALWPVLVPASCGVIAAMHASLERRASPGSFGVFVMSVLCVTLGASLGASLATSVAVTFVALSAASVPFVVWLARRLGRGDFDGLRVGRWALLALAACLALGLARRVEARSAPFEIASDRAVREALVFLDVPGIGEVPCDFLAWEHMSWECATFDRGTHGEVGLAIDEPAQIGGGTPTTLLLPSGVRGEPRRVVWPSVRAGRALTLRWAIPDGHRGTGTLVVRVDDREVGRISLPAEPTRVMHEERLETLDVGDTARLELELVEARGQSVVAIQGSWR
ncbi:MAG: DUF2029 domain-containing protein [Deltaproteobacteria bacterium]|nr:DUF2029 domain-containing protein [Deltaproteobacteria bacterium]